VLLHINENFGGVLSEALMTGVHGHDKVLADGQV
jgi:hypothetical protein